MKLKRKQGWADQRLRQAKKAHVPKDAERVKGCIIKRGDSVFGLDGQYRAHAELRRAMGDADPTRSFAERWAMPIPTRKARSTSTAS